MLLMQNDEDITTTVYRKEKSSDTENLVERACLICSTLSLLKKELTHIRNAFRNTNGCPNWIINQVFEQAKVKQRDPVPNSNVSSS